MGVLFILIYLGIVLAVIEIHTLIFTYTGLDKHIARFQVISMLTGTGFTTGESELIIDHPIRRRFGAFLILFGAFSLAVIISAISSILSDEFFTAKISIVAAVLLVVIITLKMPKVRHYLSEKLEHELEEHYDFRDLPIREALLTEDNDHVLDYFIDEKCEFNGKELGDIIGEDEDINVLFIQRGDVKIRKDRLVTELQEGDHIREEQTIEDKFGPNEDNED